MEGSTNMRKKKQNAQHTTEATTPNDEDEVESDEDTDNEEHLSTNNDHDDTRNGNDGILLARITLMVKTLPRVRITMAC